MNKVKVADLTKAQLCDHAFAHFNGVVINRKGNRDTIIKKFRKAEKEFIASR